MKKLSILTVAVVFVLSVSLAFAGPWGRGRSMGSSSGMVPGYGMESGYGPAPYAASTLNLTEEQSAKLRAIGETHVKEVAPIQNQLLSKRAELRLLWGKQNPDPAEIVAKQKEIFDLQRQLQEKAMQYHLDCRNVLTPEQQLKFADFTTTPGPGFRYGRHWGR
jgi:Spy/CpxP family protein refolding chaperone